MIVISGKSRSFILINMIITLNYFYSYIVFTVITFELVCFLLQGMTEDKGRFNDIVESGQRFVKLLARTESGKQNETDQSNEVS